MMQKGSFNWYNSDYSGGFVQAMAKAILVADKNNLSRLEKAFPQMIAAHGCPSWDTVPEGFDPRYNAERADK